jgi:hypothetical protein
VVTGIPVQMVTSSSSVNVVELWNLAVAMNVVPRLEATVIGCLAPTQGLQNLKRSRVIKALHKVLGTGPGMHELCTHQLESDLVCNS